MKANLSPDKRSKRGGVVTADLERIPNLSPWEMCRRARRALRLGDGARHTACFYLAGLADGGYRRLGHPSMTHCLKHRFAEGRSTLWNYVRVGRALVELPLIDAAWADGRLCYTVVLHLISVVTEKTQEAWIEWAVGRTEQEIKDQVARRNMGDLPSSPDRRTIGPVNVQVKVSLSATQYEVYWRAFEKFRAEYGEAFSQSKFISLLAASVLESAPDGSQPGRKPVKDRFFMLHAQPARAGGEEYVSRGEQGQPVPLDLEELGELERMLTRLPRAAVAAVDEARREEVDLAVLDPRNHGTPVPESERDVPTPEAMRQEVMARDGFQCRSCGRLSDLTVHHAHLRCMGGRTVPENLITLCATCHGSVHAFSLVIVGDPTGEVQFVDRQGRLRDRPRQESDDELGLEQAPRDLDEERDPLLETGERAEAGPEPVPMEYVELAAIPDEVDGAWWDRHRGLLDWNERLGQLELRPGYVPGARPPGPAPNDPAPNDPAPNDLAPTESRLTALVGQDAVRERLLTEVAAARLTGRAVPHLLFAGEPGLGKTHLAEALAADLRRPLVRLPAAQVRGPEALLGALAGIAPWTVVFLDEVHALPRKPAEFLYEALDGGVLSLPIRQGLQQRTIRLRLPAFTLIGASTDEDELPRAFRSRLELLRLTPYGIDALESILHAAAAQEGLTLTPEAAARLAGAARDTPRAALQLLRGVASLTVVAGASQVTEELVERLFARDGIDPDGRTPLDRAYLALIAGGRTLGVRTIAAKLGAGEQVVREVVEPFLLRRGWIDVTSRGRTRTERAA